MSVMECHIGCMRCGNKVAKLMAKGEEIQALQLNHYCPNCEDWFVWSWRDKQ